MRASSLKAAVLILGMMALMWMGGRDVLSRSIGNTNALLLRNIKTKVDLINTVQHPALLLGGGSNVLLGLRAENIGKQLGHPAYNLGLVNEAQDYRNSLALLEVAAKPGDTVIYASRGFHSAPPELEQYVRLSAYGVPLVLKDIRGGLRLPDTSAVRSLMPLQSNLLARYKPPGKTSPLGDWHHCPSGLIAVAQKYTPLDASRDSFIQELADFSARLKARNVNVFFVMPDLLVSNDDVEKWHARHELMQMKVKAKGGVWLPLPLDQVYDSNVSDFCDHPVHPTEQRAAIKSTIIAQQLLGKK